VSPFSPCWFHVVAVSLVLHPPESATIRTLPLSLCTQAAIVGAVVCAKETPPTISAVTAALTTAAKSGDCSFLKVPDLRIQRRSRLRPQQK
jgi:hypothetical protein